MERAYVPSMSTMPAGEPRPPCIAGHLDGLRSCLGHASELAARLEKLADVLTGGTPREVSPTPPQPRAAGLVSTLGDLREQTAAALSAAEQQINRIENALG